MMPFTDINVAQSQFYLNERINEINTLLQNNFYVIANLEKRINSLVEMNEKIAKELLATSTPTLKIQPLVENSPPEERIIEKIFLKKEYRYSLALKNSFKAPLYKDRNFNLHIALFDEHRNQVVNRNSIPLKISIYTASQDPEIIDANKQGLPIMKGNLSVDLTQGHASFQKISIREVSSKFERGLINIVVSVKAPPFDKNDDIDYKSIRPLVIKDVTIRAKKI